MESKKSFCLINVTATRKTCIIKTMAGTFKWFRAGFIGDAGSAENVECIAIYEAVARCWELGSNEVLIKRFERKC